MKKADTEQQAALTMEESWSGACFLLPSLSPCPGRGEAAWARALQPELCLSLLSPKSLSLLEEPSDCAIVFVATWLDSTVCFDFSFSLLC